jgi:excinuclease UvrABC nuclease subunit
MIWQREDCYDNRVVKYSLWTPKFKYSLLEERAGMYLFVDDQHDVKYVGKAGAGRMVAEIRDAISRGKDKGASLVKALYTNSDPNALSLERDLINKYNPPNNEI